LTKQTFCAYSIRTTLTQSVSATAESVAYTYDAGDNNFYNDNKKAKKKMHIKQNQSTEQTVTTLKTGL